MLPTQKPNSKTVSTLPITYDDRTLAFAKDYSNKLLAIDVNIGTTAMLDVTWDMLGDHFKPAEVSIKQELVEKYWKK